MAVGVERDVQDLLISQSQRRSKRGQGKAVYPVEEYSLELANLDIWDNMFFESIWGSPTVYNFPTPPAHVLDIGCGTGWWIMNMARRWPDTTFIGFDIAEIQPYLPSYEHFADIADRITWINGNFLDVFPFPDDHFDYVRACRAALAIPEDEWQWFLEGIWRIMKPGAVLEIIDEDLIFPNATIPGLPQTTNSPSPTPPRLEILTKFDTKSSGTSSTSSPDTVYLTPVDEKSSQNKPKSRRSRLTSFVASVTSKDHSPDSPERPRKHTREGSPPTSLFDYSIHPQNHAKLKTAWDSMLASRFISNKVLSILPFYLSTLFSGVESFHLYTVPLPSSTPLEHEPWDDDDSLYSIPRNRNAPCKPHPVVPICPDYTINHPIVTELPRLQAMDLYELAGMHLHYVVGFIRACKATIKEEYQKLFPDEDIYNPRVERAMNGDADLFYNAARPDPFEVEWNDWVCDMEDRMRLRHRFPEQLSWPEPRTIRGGKPRWRHWRKAVDQRLSLENRTVFEFPPNPHDLCRSVRAYMAWKGPKPAPVT